MTCARCGEALSTWRVGRNTWTGSAYGITGPADECGYSFDTLALSEQMQPLALAL